MAALGTKRRCKPVTSPIDLAPRIEEHRFPDPETLALTLARDVAARLRSALSMRGQASLALSGGNTPKRFLQRLSEQALDWANVHVTLVDERWVPADHERSNAGLLQHHLLRNHAAAARFLPLYREYGHPDQAIPGLEQALANLPQPFDAAVLGMGNDGHTASFFPGGDHLAEALDPASTARLLPMTAPGAGEPRITLTLPVLLAARHLFLHIEGPDKQATLQRAVSGEQGGSDYPIRNLLLAIGAPLPVYACP